MRNPLTWVFLVIGLLVGSATTALIGSSAAGGASTKPATAVKMHLSEKGKSDEHLPFHIGVCQTSNCTDAGYLPDALESYYRGEHETDLPSNMSVNGGDGSNVQKATVDFGLQSNGSKTAADYLAITIFEDPNDGYARRMQTLYIPYVTATYHLIACPMNTSPPTGYSKPACPKK